VPVRILELVDALDRLPGTIERELDSRVDDLSRLIQGSVRVRDDLELAIDDVGDDELRRVMRGQLAQLDSLLEDLADRARAISAYDVFDPIRVLSADLRLEAEQPPLATA
jgi:hypothetical protein